MPYEAQIRDLIPDGTGDVLWLGPKHAQQLIDGLVVAPGPKRAIILQGLLGRFDKAASVLAQASGLLAGDGVVIALATSRLNPRIKGGFTRRELLVAFAKAGYDVTSCSLIRDPRVPWIPMGLEPTLESVPEELEEMSSARILISARRAAVDVPVCSIVTATPDDLIHTPSVSFEVIRARADEEGRARTWNRAARTALGRYIAFVDEADRTRPGWLDRLLESFEANPRAAAAGGHAVGFGPVTIPCHNLPFALAGEAPGQVPALAGTGLLVDRKAFVEAGGFDEALGSEHDGPDLCLRLRGRGSVVMHCPSGAVTRGKSAGRSTSTASARFFIFKWAGRIAADPGKPAGAGLRTNRMKASRRQSPAPVLWSGPFLTSSGYGEEARGFLLALDRQGIAVRANPTAWHTPETELSPRNGGRLAALAVTEAPERFINVVHSVPVARLLKGGSNDVFPLVEYFKPHPGAVRNIGRTMYETDRLPRLWADQCNQMDEIWVPSKFNLDTFATAGVAREKLHRIPGAVDFDLFDPAVPPLYIPGAGDFVFLSVFQWSLRKGWDVLVSAFLDEFGQDESVTLVLKALPQYNSPMALHEGQLDHYVRRVLGRDPAANPRIMVLGGDLSVEEMPRLYRSADAFVLPSRGEGYGRPYLEAMAMGIPTIGTRSGGNLDFMTDDNSYLVDCKVVDIPEAGVRETPDFAGHRWAEPDARDLRRAMRRVFEERGEAKAKAAEARRHVRAGHSWEAVARAVVERLEAAGASPLRSTLPMTTAVNWEGPHRIAFGLAEVNREMARAMSATGVDLKTTETPDTRPWLTGRPPEVTVRHQWPPNFEPPASGRWVTFQPWEYGSLPAAWVEPMNRKVDEVWVPSRYVRDCYVRSGMDPGKVAVVPYGIDPSRFHPDAAPMELSTTKKHRFLFVGGTIPRKGADILLETYIATFGAEDDVCLVIKDLGADSFYLGQGLGQRIRELQSDPGKPEIVYLDTELPAAGMPGLFTACSCLVHPYRGEGFGLPIAEAMACGLPVIVPRHGACLDFCDDSVSYLVTANEVRMPEPRVGQIPTVNLPWWAEVDRKELAAAMRRVVDEPKEARAIGREASKRIRTEFTWQRAAQVAAARISELAKRPNRLTACVIARDEEGSLPACLRSVSGLADEVVVVDTGSTDRTAEVAAQLGAKVSRFAWSGDLAAARNESLRHATGNWVLVIDADERLDDAGRDEIRYLIRGRPRNAHLLRQITRGRQDPVGVERPRLRLFPNDPALRFAGRIAGRLADASGTVVLGQPSGVVLHHDASRSGRRRRVRRLLPLIEEVARAEGGIPALALELGAAYLELGLPAKAEDELAHAIEQVRWKPASAALLPDAFALRARALVGLGRFSDAVEECRRAIRLAPHLAAAHATLSDALKAEGRLEEAAEAYRIAMSWLPRIALAPSERGGAGRA